MPWLYNGNRIILHSSRRVGQNDVQVFFEFVADPDHLRHVELLSALTYQHPVDGTIGGINRAYVDESDPIVDTEP